MVSIGLESGLIKPDTAKDARTERPKLPIRLRRIILARGGPK